MGICKICVLNDNIQSVKMNKEGICNYCEQYVKNKDELLKLQIENKEKQLIEASNLYKDGHYQVLLAYSGGKDSTYTLYLLRKKYNFSVLTVTFDNGFLTEQSRLNIHTVTAALEADNIVIKPSFSQLAKIFDLASKQELFSKKAIERASSICTACIGMVKSIIYKEAILRRIPYISFGWTPGQVNLKASVVKLDYRMILANQRQIKEPIVKKLGEEYSKYFIDDDWLEGNKEYIPSLIYPLVFINYNEDVIQKTIQSIGWEKPGNTDTNSTNCLLNSYANDIHMKRYGYNPYSLEIAELVREGVITREEGLNRISGAGMETVINEVKNEISKYIL